MADDRAAPLAAFDEYARAIAAAVPVERRALARRCYETGVIAGLLLAGDAGLPAAALAALLDRVRPRLALATEARDAGT